MTKLKDRIAESSQSQTVTIEAPRTGSRQQPKKINEKASLYEGHGFSRVPMSLRLTQGHENHGERCFSTVPHRFGW